MSAISQLSDLVAFDYVAFFTQVALRKRAVSRFHLFFNNAASRFGCVEWKAEDARA